MNRRMFANSWPLFLAAIVVATACRPGDATFIADEPALLHSALALNHTPGAFYFLHLPFTICQVCQLTPTHGLFYGPAPVWLYQLLLLITYDPRALVVLHALLLASVTAASLAWLTRSLRVSPWLAVITMLSPWLWIYHRMLWDNNLCVPLCTLMFAGYADFLLTRHGLSLAAAAACAAMLPLVHLMAFAIVAPMAAHAIFFQLAPMLKRKWPLLAALVLVNIFGWPYWQYAFSFYVPAKPAENLSPWLGWIYPLLGAHHLSTAGLGKNLGSDWVYTLPGPAPYLVTAAITFSLISYVAVWIGMILAVRSIWRLLHNRKTAAVSDHIAAVALGTAICQAALDGIMRIYGGPHYFNSTWIAYAILAWLAVDAVQKTFTASILVRLAMPAYAAAMLIVLSAMIYKIARDGGCRERDYGTDLSEQIAAAKIVLSYSPDSPREIYFPQWAIAPWPLQTLGELLPPSAAPVARPMARLIIRYRQAYYGDARIVVEAHPL